MKVNFEILESQLSETEMALYMLSNVAFYSAIMAGADVTLMKQQLKQHEDNFVNTGQNKAAHIIAGMIALIDNATNKE